MIKNDVKGEFHTPWMILIIILMIAGFGLINYSYSIKDMYMVNDPNYEYCYAGYIIFKFWGIGFIFPGVYLVYMYILNVIIKPKVDVVYLKSIEGYRSVFVDKKGKQYIISTRELIPEKFYEVLKTRNYIHEVKKVIEEELEKPELKESYWLNFYSMFGNFNDILLLPWIYLVLMAAILIFINSSSILKILAGIFSIYVLFILIYDYIKKRKKKENNGEVEDKELFQNEEKVDYEKIAKFQIKLQKLVKLIAAIIINIGIILMFIFCDETIARICISPFLSVAICFLGIVFGDFLNKEKICDIFNKLFAIIIYVYITVFGIWGMLEISKESVFYIIFVIPFMVIGYLYAYNNFKNKDK